MPPRVLFSPCKLLLGRGVGRYRLCRAAAAMDESSLRVVLNEHAPTSATPVAEPHLMSPGLGRHGKQRLIVRHGRWQRHAVVSVMHTARSTPIDTAHLSGPSLRHLGMACIRTHNLAGLTSG